jgi:hypothetical protein
MSAPSTREQLETLTLAAYNRGRFDVLQQMRAEHEIGDLQVLEFVSAPEDVELKLMQELLG